MSPLPGRPGERLPAAVARRVDRACDQFENAFLAGQRPAIEAYLAAADEVACPALLLELVRLEVAHRRRAGEQPDGTEYQRRFPQAGPSLATLLEELWPSQPLRISLAVTEGPHQGKAFNFEEHSTFLVGRSPDAHCQLPSDDRYFSRRHFLIDVNPPRCQLLDLKSRNGTFVNGARVDTADLKDGDEIRGGHTVFRVVVSQAQGETDTRCRLEDDRAQDVTRRFSAALAPMPSPSLPATHQPSPPTLPGYRILAELGRGGMGVVYRALRLQDGVEVALKTTMLGQSVTHRHVQRFLREIDILRGLHHRNIVRYQASCVEGGALYLDMELVRGNDAGRWLKEKGPRPVAVATRIVYRVLKGLAHAHDKGFVHRDVKPSNILLDGSRREVKLADFGLARAYEVSRVSGVTLQGELGGTVAFMAPEQVTHFRDVKPLADQYSTAATLYNLLTGCYTHDLPRGRDQQLIQILTDEPIPIQQRRPDLPGELAAVIHRALSREPESRFPNANAFMEALLPFAR